MVIYITYERRWDEKKMPKKPHQSDFDKLRVHMSCNRSHRKRVYIHCIVRYNVCLGTNILQPPVEIDVMCNVRQIIYCCSV